MLRTIFEDHRFLIAISGANMALAFVNGSEGHWITALIIFAIACFGMNVGLEESSNN